MQVQAVRPQPHNSMVECPECAARLPVGTLLLGEIVSCNECGAELEVRATNPQIILQLAPPVEEDWGE